MVITKEQLLLSKFIKYLYKQGYQIRSLIRLREWRDEKDFPEWGEKEDFPERYLTEEEAIILTDFWLKSGLI